MRKVSFASLSSPEWIALIIGFLVAFAVALLVVNQFMRFLRSHKLRGFAFYRFGLSALLMVLLLTGVLVN